MSTRAVIAYVMDDGSWRGVWNHQDGGPEDLGNHLIDRVQRHRGAMDAVVDEAVRNAPHGWSSYAARERSDDDEEPSFFGPEHIPEYLDFHYLYLFDVAARRLDVIEATEENIAAREVLATVTFAADGTPTPPRLQDPPPMWKRIRVMPQNEGWTSETRARAARVRDAIDAETDDTAALRRILRAALEHAVVSAWPDWSEERNPVTAEWGWAAGAQSHEILLGRVRLRYGCPMEWRFQDEVTLFDGGGNSAELDLSPSAWAAHLEAVGVKDGPGIADAVLAVVGPASLDMHGEFEASEGKLFQFLRVVEGPDSETTMSLSRARAIDPECSVDDQLGVTVSVTGWPWALVDWMAEDDSDR